jgi:hypothetical protein
MSAEASTISPIYDVTQLRGWLPVDAVIRDGQPGFLWLEMEDAALHEPFFEQTVKRLRSERPQLAERFTGYETLLQLESITPVLQPAGFILHSSRCGSTVVANALRTLNHARLISEPHVVDKLITRFFTDVQGDRRKELLYSVLVRAAINALGQGRDTIPQRFFVKLSSISVLQSARLKKIWPNASWAFIYRHPVEVMISNLEDPPPWLDAQGNLRMAAELLEMSENAVRGMCREEFCARVLGRFYSAAAAMMDQQVRLLNYEQLSLESLGSIIEFFGVVPTEQEKEAIGRGLSIYAKDPAAARLFVADSEKKRNAASSLVWEMAEELAIPSYDKLEQLRISQD